MRNDKDNLIVELTFEYSTKIIEYCELLEPKKKFKISAKEADETRYWLLLCKRSKSYPDPLTLIDDLESIQRVISKIVSSSKDNRSFSNHQII